jgi:molecular chaperone GrpE
MLNVKDSLELGLGAAEQDASLEALLEGQRATLKLLETALERFGVTEIDPAGEAFDPEWHEAISMLPSGEAEPGSVLHVVQKGYRIHERLLRPARVVVAREPDEPPAAS